jgi:hypothetical protein
MNRAEQLFCKKLGDVGESLKLQRVACGIEEEHGGLLTHFALEADVWFDDEVDASIAKAIGERLPLVHRKNDAEVRDRDVVAIDGIVVIAAVARAWLQVRDDLVAEEIEVDPLWGTATLRAAQCRSVEETRGVEVVNGKGDMKRSERHGVLLALILRWNARRLDHQRKLHSPFS